MSGWRISRGGRVIFTVGLGAIFSASAPAQSFPMLPRCPLVPGTTHQCVYEDSDGFRGDMVLSFTGPVNVGSTPTVRMETRIGPRYERLYLSWSDSFLRLHRVEDSLGDTIAFSNPEEILPTDLPGDADHLCLGDGGQFTAQGANGTSMACVSSHGLETISIAAGTMQALHVRFRRDWTAGGGQYHGFDDIDMWLAEGIGWVKWNGSGQTTDDEGTDSYWERWELAVAPILPRNAEFLDVALPPLLVEGQCAPATVSVRNTGSMPWSEQELFRAAETTGGTRLLLPPGVSVPQGAVGEFTGEVCAPAPGPHTFTFQMVQDGVAFFGPAFDVPVAVTPARDALCAAASIPAQAEPHESVPVIITMRNDGGLTWSEADLFHLAEHVSGRRLLLPPAMRVAPGEMVEFWGAIEAPAAPGPLALRFQMVQDGVAYFGEEFAASVSVVFTGRGDVDGSGAVALEDAALLRGHLLGTQSLDAGQLTRARANTDAVIDIADLVWVLNVAARAAGG